MTNSLAVTGILKLGVPLETLLTEFALGILDKRYEASHNERVVANQILSLRDQYLQAEKDRQTWLPLVPCAEDLADDKK